MRSRHTKLDESVQLRAAQHVVTASHGNSLVLLDLVGMRYFTVTGAGPAIWSMLCDGSSVTNMTNAIANHYQVDTSQVQGDVEQIVQDLLNHGLVKPNSR